MSKLVNVATIVGPKGDTGVHTHMREVMRALAERKTPCIRITPYDAPLWQVYPLFGLRKTIAPVSREAGVRWYRHWHERMLHKALLPILLDDPDCIVYAQCPLSARAALAARRNSGQAVVMAVHFNISQADEWAGKGTIAPGGSLYRAMLSLDRDVLARLDGLVFVSAFMREQLTARIPEITNVPYVLVPNFMPDPGSPDINEASRDLINIGTLEPRKNQGYLLEILAAAKARGARLHLTLVGDGPDRTRLETKATELGVRNLVRFTGYVRNGARLLREHRAYIHSAVMENLPFTLIEALARGLPVFAPAVGGIPEVFDDDVEGRLLPLNDPGAAAVRLVEWMNSPIRMKAASAAARSRFLSRFQSNVLAGQLVSFLDRVAHPPVMTLNPSHVGTQYGNEQFQASS